MGSKFSLYFTPPEPVGSYFSYLKCALVEAHAEQVEQWGSTGNVLVNGQPVKQDGSCPAGSRIEVIIPDHKEEAVDGDWRMVWENDELMVIHKPALLPVSRTTRNLYMTLISLIRRQTNYPEAQLLHRLDTETSGLIVLAKNALADKKWKPRLNSLIDKKIYQAWVAGSPTWEHKTVDVMLSEKQGSAIRSQVYVVETPDAELYSKPKSSKTAFTVLRREAERSLIECELFTGRKHQIRSHLAYLGHPIIGDKIYAHQGKYYLKRLQGTLTDDDYEVLGSPFQLLMAARLALNLETERIVVTTESEL